MNIKNFINKSLLFFLGFIVLSCASRKDVVYYQDIDTFPNSKLDLDYEITIQPDDLLSIIVSADNPEVALPFNLPTIASPAPSRPDQVRSQETLQLYLVDHQGMINFPVIGKLKISGMTRTQVLELLKEKVGEYVKDPMITMRLTNFKVSIQGEVTMPGVYPVTTERITLIEALSMARDLTILGKRNNILIIREIDGVRTYNRVDITKSDFINSPFYYLAQNDVVYVEPNKNKVNGSAVGPNTGVLISVTSLIITVITLIVTTSK